MTTHRPNQVAAQESVLSSGTMAEHESGDIQLNLVTREGSNHFSLYGIAGFTNNALQDDNLTEKLRNRGLTVNPSIDRIWDYGLGVGGPIARDKVWFYSANRWWGTI